jgi:hypothetical protein
MEIGGRTVTSKENEEAKVKIMAKVVADEDRGGRDNDRSGSGDGGGTGVYERDEGRAVRCIHTKYKRKKFARHLHQTLFRPPLPVQFGHFSIIVSLITLGLVRRSESHSLINQAKIDIVHNHRALGTREKSSTTLTERHDNAEPYMMS